MFYYFADQTYSEAGEGFTASDYSYGDYKQDVYMALENRFGRDGVVPGGKAFVVKENTYRIDTDVVPCMEFRVYRSDTHSGGKYDSGVKFITSSGKSVMNFPEQHIVNGRKKNNDSNHEYKKIVRIIKKMRYEMIDQEIAEADGASSFLIECAVFNVPDYIFGNPINWYLSVMATLDYLITATSDDAYCQQWTEVNKIKWLFQPTFYAPPSISRQQAHEFFKAARRHIL